MGEEENPEEEQKEEWETSLYKMESKDYKRLAIISGAVVTGLIGFFAFGVAGAFLGYIIFLLICLIFWAVRNSNSQ